jgi:hypothetical protein
MNFVFGYEKALAQAEMADLELLNRYAKFDWRPLWLKMQRRYPDHWGNPARA